MKNSNQQVAKHNSINKDMVIGDVVEKHPIAAEIMSSYGLSCIGCHANPHETIEMGAIGHGMTDDNINSMLNEMNEVIEKEPAESILPEIMSEEKEIIPLSLTELAVSKAKSVMEAQNKKGYALRVGVKPGGCAGFFYFMDFEKTPRKEDAVLEFDGLKVFVDLQSARLLRGTELDYAEGLTESGFKFINPNAKSSCGCEKSFS